MEFLERLPLPKVAKNGAAIEGFALARVLDYSILLSGKIGPFNRVTSSRLLPVIRSLLKLGKQPLFQELLSSRLVQTTVPGLSISGQDFLTTHGKMLKLSPNAKLFISTVSVSGVAVVALAWRHSFSSDLRLLISLLAVSVIAAKLKVPLPGLSGTMSVNLPFILVAVAVLGLAEALAIACASTATQCLWKKSRASPIQVLFNICNMANAVGLAYYVLAQQPAEAGIALRATFFLSAAAVFFVTNVFPVAFIISLTEDKGLVPVSLDLFYWSFPHYVASSGVAFVVLAINPFIGWKLPILLLPVMYLLYRSYKTCFEHAQISFKAKAKRGGLARGASAH